jgi:hypothetical protein
MGEICKDLSNKELVLIIVWALFSLLHRGFVSVFSLLDRLFDHRLEIHVVDAEEVNGDFEERVLGLCLLSILGGSQVDLDGESSDATLICTGGHWKEKPVTLRRKGFFADFSVGRAQQGHKFYAVRRGVVPGTYGSWEECSRHVTGFRNARFKSFRSIRDAENFLHDFFDG